MFSRRTHAAAALILTMHTALVAWAATLHSPSIDEVGHMAAGLSHWRFGRFDLYRVNPPLVRVVATAPVTLLDPQIPWSGYSKSPGGRPEFDCGLQFIDANGGRSFRLFAVARLACIPFTLLGGYLCYRWAGELYGARGGLLALSLWCFCPNVLAHAQMITPDVGAASLGAAACYLFWRWLRAPSWGLAFAAGVVLGLAELTKATFLVLYAVWPLAWVLWKAAGDARRTEFIPLASLEASQRAKRMNREVSQSRNGMNSDLPQVAQLALMAILSVYVLNVGYGFEGSFQPLGKFEFISKALGGDGRLALSASRGRNRFADTPLARFRVPLPANYLRGIDQQKNDFERGMHSYLRGEWRHGGWWYYYLYGLAVKVPLGSWAFFVMAAMVGPALRVTWSARGVGRGRRPTMTPNGAPPRTTWRDEFVLLLPAAVILTLVSSQTGFNHHLRYVLPIFPFVFIWIGRLGRLFETARKPGGHCPQYERARRPLPTRSRVIRALGLVALAWSIGGSLWYYPHSLSYFNELAGGPLGGRWHLLNSNLDWGQDLLYLKRWLDDHPRARPLGLAYFGLVDPRAAGIEFRLPPLGPLDEDGAPTRPLAAVGPRPGWYAVSVMMLHGGNYGIHDGTGKRFGAKSGYFTYFQHFRPVAMAGYSICIYHLLPDEVSRVRRELGLPPLRPSASESAPDSGAARSPAPQARRRLA